MTTHPEGGGGTGPGRAAELAAERRIDTYRRQNGTRIITPRQRRRIDHKAARAAKRALPTQPTEKEWTPSKPARGPQHGNQSNL